MTNLNALRGNILALASRKVEELKQILQSGWSSLSKPDAIVLTFLSKARILALYLLGMRQLG